jgi:hypothetical protein
VSYFCLIWQANGATIAPEVMRVDGTSIKVARGKTPKFTIFFDPPLIRHDDP